MAYPRTRAASKKDAFSIMPGTSEKYLHWHVYSCTFSHFSVLKAKILALTVLSSILCSERILIYSLILISSWKRRLKSFSTSAQNWLLNLASQALTHPLNPSSTIPPSQFSRISFPDGHSLFWIYPLSIYLQVDGHTVLSLFFMHHSPLLTLNAKIVGTVCPYLCFGWIQLKGTAWWNRKTTHFIVKLLWVKSLFARGTWASYLISLSFFK